MSDVEEAITRAHHDEWARVIAALTRRFGDLDIAEEAAFATAVQRWPADGLPPNPGGWLTTTAGRKAIDRIRRSRPKTVSWSDRSRPACQKSLKEVREAVSDRGGGVRSGGEAAHKGVRPPARGGAKAKELRS